ncbi:MAG: 2-amino-4-hydroxy-6-hydroxymethyldihydropteridine diphosphokinase [Alphaproteobacteria bacterium]|nr:2-amino-4-hydroxy-6-hydroxymethyldihydropteridine diphosphokinase [Alphaproteobacteria bacterium]
MKNEDLTQHEVILALGSNLGDRLAVLQAAVRALKPYVSVEACSPVYETTPAYVTDQPLFLNAVIKGTTALDPRGLLFTVKNIERELGRRPTFRYGPRVIDIDIIFYDQLVMHTPELSIPHPLMTERAFVLKPLADIDPQKIHPILNKSAASLLQMLAASDPMQAIKGTLPCS